MTIVVVPQSDSDRASANVCAGALDESATERHQPFRRGCAWSQRRGT